MAATRNKRVEVTLKTSQGLYEVPVRITRRKGIRHLKVSVDLYNEVVVNVPAKVADDHAIHFLQEQADWIIECLNRCPGTPALVEYFEHRAVISGMGREWTVEIAKGPRPQCVIEPAQDRVRLRHNPADPIEPQLLAGLRAFARESIPPRVADFAERTGLNYKRLLVRDQRTRWGSCSEHRTLSFNWRLVMLPVALHDYIIWHELAHLTHLNHSPAYWALLDAYDPKSKAHDAGVTEWSSLLMRLGRGSEAARAGVVKIDG